MDGAISSCGVVRRLPSGFPAGAGAVARRGGEAPPGRPRPGRARRGIAGWGVLWAALVLGLASGSPAATPAGTVIRSTARVTYDVGARTGVVVSSNTHELTTVGLTLIAGAALTVECPQPSPWAGSAVTAAVSIENTGTVTLPAGRLEIAGPTG
ncbi:MAG: hypothetical protein Kow0092_32870 [Deferrisomatales bacterium]